MMEYLQNLEFWHWWIAAFVFIGLEIFAPGFVFLWMGLAAIVVGLLMTLFSDMGWELQFAIWGMVSVISMMLSRRYIDKNPIKTDQPNLNNRASQHVGRVFTLDAPVHNGVGKIGIGDSQWKITCPDDLPAGATVTITGYDGVVLRAELKSSSLD